ncbi:hypothetical protein KY290_014253 [Solanum tuberosum]|uniref:Uncharacterized protein n=1 Tax=Solanum tuberosum TaxID=4113 RepID=A0ABQ7VP39_SOLTU|nr:hypothetical protein KY289_014315 [Solanum tuberosum]KAH0699436.1 hypothetical protein KY284_013651 [Solanum tuberosum]KAH0770272.1 hypothetical protein KY290_014253 [Solanum tuberosum]
MVFTHKFTSSVVPPSKTKSSVGSPTFSLRTVLLLLRTTNPKTALLERRRADYCARRHGLSQKLLPPHSSLATSAEEQLIQCDSAYEIGSTSTTCNDHSNLLHLQPTVKERRESNGLLE